MTCRLDGFPSFLINRYRSHLGCEENVPCRLHIHDNGYSLSAL